MAGQVSWLSMSLSDSIFIFGLALVIFGPRKLPEIGRQLGKLLYEFRRASNEFKMQIDEELRAAEQADRQKQLAASVTPVTPAPALEAPVAEAPAVEAPVVRPPSEGVTVSTESPTARVIPVQDEAAELEKVGENHPEMKASSAPEMTSSNGLHHAPEQATTHHD
jgi:TatA/E family protein of Tat protein translocase